MPSCSRCWASKATPDALHLPLLRLLQFRRPTGVVRVICEICFWEDDHLQLCFPDARGGANAVSLIEAQVNYVQWGACERRFRAQVRPATIDDVKDDRWFPLWEKRVELPDEEAPLRGEEACYWLRAPR